MTAEIIPNEADRVLRIWGEYKRKEGGVVSNGYPRHSAGFVSGGSSNEDSFDELVTIADMRTGSISDAILDDMAAHGHNLQVMAIWNQYLCDVAMFRGYRDSDLLIDGCCVFLIEARRRGIAI